MTVLKGQCVALLGPNGAGKTLYYIRDNGCRKIKWCDFFDRRLISEMSTEARIKGGISVSPEGRRVFANLSVEENLIIGGALKPDGKSKKELPIGTIPFRFWVNADIRWQGHFRRGTTDVGRSACAYE